MIKSSPAEVLEWLRRQPSSDGQKTECVPEAWKVAPKLYFTGGQLVAQNHHENHHMLRITAESERNSTDGRRTTVEDSS